MDKFNQRRNTNQHSAFYYLDDHDEEENKETLEILVLAPRVNKFGKEIPNLPTNFNEVNRLHKGI